MTNTTNDRRRFLSYELGLLTLKAALSTRDDKYPVYDKGTKIWQRSQAKKVLREWLAVIEEKYSKSGITEAEHVAFIAEVSEKLSNQLAHCLHDGRFRVGVAQKLVNVHLKYLWTAGFCPEPPHCPIDGIIRDAAGIGYLWTRSDSIEEYKEAIADLKTISETKDLTLAQWELETFRRRGDEEL